MLLKSVVLLFLVAVLCVVTYFKERIRPKVFVYSAVSVLYVLILVSFTLLHRESVSDVSLVPFDTFFRILSVRWYGNGEYIFIAIVGNMLLFMPFGMIFGNVFVCKCKELVCLVSGLVVSLLIECTQLLYSIGTFEIDDLIINTWGAVIGCAVVNTIIKKNKNVLDNLTTLSPLLAFCVVVFAFCVGPVFKEIL